MNSVTCFSKKELRSYLLGDLTDEDSVVVASHVENCADCETTVSELDRDSDTLMESLREPVEQDEAPVSVYRLAASRAKSIWSESPSDGISDPTDPVSVLPKLRDYELLEPLAQGGMGTVYRARHVRLNRQVALKVLPARWLKNPVVVARFEREMQAVGSLTHPAIVQATDGGDADGVHFLVMELIDGPDCATAVRDLGPLPTADACEIARQAAIGMAYVHERGIIHRDLKPSNLMLTKAGDLKVLDLGLARVVGEQLVGDELTTVGQLMGTLDFMAPEQLENSHEVDQRTDIYSLGATLYKMLSGDSPHVSESAEPLLTKLRRIASESPPPLKQKCEDLPAELCKLVDGMLSHDADDRPESMQSVAESLACFSENSNLQSLTQRAIKAHRRQPSDRDQRDFADSISFLGSNVASQPSAASGGRGGKRFLRDAVAALVLLAITLGVVITLHTTAGQLVIQTSSPEVQVRILKSGHPHRDITVTQKAETFRLGAGQYEIEIVSNSDGLVIENGTFTLNRGDVWLAKIVHRPNAAAAQMGTAVDMGMDMEMDTSMDRDDTPQPTFEGKTLSQWLLQLRTERSPGQLLEACEALAKLAEKENMAETVSAMLAATRPHNGRTIYRKADGDGISIWSTVQQFLATQDQNIVVAEMTTELERRDGANRDFILDYLSDYRHLTRPAADEKLLRLIERIAVDQNSASRMRALVVMNLVAPAEMAIPRIVTALSDPDVAVQLYATKTLIELESDLPLVLSTLRQVVRSASLAQRAEAAWQLGNLGPKAAPALPDLVACIEEENEELTARQVYYAVRTTANGGVENVGQISVKDAAVRALAESRDDKVLPALIAEWERRVLAITRPTKSSPAWAKNRQLSSANYNIQWVADAIGRLSGMRPKVARTARGTTVTTWHVGYLDFPLVYKTGFEHARDVDTDEILSAAKMLLPRAQDFEFEAARQHITRLDRTPSERELALELELAELLANAWETRAVLAALLSRVDVYQRLDEKKWDRAKRDVAISDYRDAILKIVLEAKDSDTTIFPYLLSKAKSGSNECGILLTSLLDQCDTESREAAIARIMELVAERGTAEAARTVDAFKGWLSEPENREIVHGMLREGEGENWEHLMAGLLRGGMADEESMAIVTERFHGDAISRTHVIDWMLLSLDDQPALSGTIIDLFKLPLLDQPAAVMVRGNQRSETSYRAAEFLPKLRKVPDARRASFRTYLTELSKEGINGEARSAGSVLEYWKQ